MSQPYRPGAEIAILLRRASDERRRACRAATLAAKYDQEPPAPDLKPVYADMAALHRRIEVRHLVAADMHEKHIAMVVRSLSDPSAGQPTFMGTIAAALGTRGVAAAMCGSDTMPAFVAASGPDARKAQELERVLGEGPAISAIAEGTVVQSADDALLRRWPRYGAAVAELGVRAVIATPLRVGGSCLGALCGYDSAAISADTVAASATLADALAYELLDGSLAGSPSMPFEGAEFHQAVGMIAAYHDRDIADARALLLARAFAANRPLSDVARDVIEGRTRLDLPRVSSDPAPVRVDAIAKTARRYGPFGRD